MRIKKSTSILRQVPTMSAGKIRLGHLLDFKEHKEKLTSIAYNFLRKKEKKFTRICESSKSRWSKSSR
ncbi:hypothetical protein RirG_114450 [Rhizophagus irregularis DAOM 197198w]|nr:hypothetical protein RirG_114450 [Rhizophagus irregularis DAOM 197198w]